MALAGLLVVSNSPSALGAALLGSGNSGGSGTVLSGLHLHGGLLVFVSRLVPLELSLVLAWWVLQRLGPRVLEPVPLLTLIALSLSLRLVFEHALYGYYFMAFAVLLLLVDVAAGRIRGSVVAWLAGVSVVYMVGPTTSRRCGPPQPGSTMPTGWSPRCSSRSLWRWPHARSAGTVRAVRFFRGSRWRQQAPWPGPRHTIRSART